VSAGQMTERRTGRDRECMQDDLDAWRESPDSCRRSRTPSPTKLHAAALKAQSVAAFQKAGELDTSATLANDTLAMIQQYVSDSGRGDGGSTSAAAPDTPRDARAPSSRRPPASSKARMELPRPMDSAPAPAGAQAAGAGTPPAPRASLPSLPLSRVPQPGPFSVSARRWVASAPSSRSNIKEAPSLSARWPERDVVTSSLILPFPKQRGATDMPPAKRPPNDPVRI